MLRFAVPLVCASLGVAVVAGAIAFLLRTPQIDFSRPARLVPIEDAASDGCSGFYRSSVIKTTTPAGVSREIYESVALSSNGDCPATFDRVYDGPCGYECGRFVVLREN